MITSRSIVASQDKNSNIVSTPPSTDIEQEADRWFTSTDSPMPRRDFYTKLNTTNPLLIYKDALAHKISWIDYPEQIALRTFFPPPEIEGFVPTQVNIDYYNSNIESVLVTLISHAGTGASESRFDFIKADNTWKIVWAGQRSISLK